MGRTSKSGGIRERQGKIQIDFTYGTKRIRRYLDLKWSVANERRAHLLLAEIKEKIRHGIFELEAYFPSDSVVGDDGDTFQQYATVWSDSLTELAAATRQDYAKALRRIWLPAFGARPIKSIRYSEVVTVLNNACVHGKTRNNVLIPVRQVFAFAMRDGAIEKNPAEQIENARVQVKAPDPFDLDEVDAILGDIYDHEPEPVGNYFTAAFYGGFRPSEIIAIRWTDVDEKRRAVRIEKAVVRGKAKASTKTHDGRDVELTARAWAAFEAQKKFTRLAGKQVFNNPAIKAAWTDIQSQNRIWVRSLDRLKIRRLYT